MDNVATALWNTSLHQLSNVSSIFSTTFLRFATTLVVMAFALYYLYKFLFVGKSDKQPGLPPLLVKPWPIVGSLPEMVRNRPTFRWILKLMKDANTEIACIRFGNVHVIPVTCPEISCEFLKTQDAVFASRPTIMAADVTTKGFLTTALSPMGDQWKKMRKVMVNEMLSPIRHRWLQDKRDKEADNLVRYVYNLCMSAGGLVDVRVAAQQYCGNVPRQLLFSRRYFGKGKENGGPGFEEEEHISAVFTVLAYLYAFCVSDYIPMLRGLDLDGHEKVMKEAMRVIGKYQDPIIDERIQQWKSGKKSGKEDPDDLLDVLICLKDGKGNPILTADEIKAQLAEFMIATVDNPSNAVEWALAEMLNNPEILKKATEEIDRVVGKERLVEESDFPKLNYVKACAREAFRLHPIAPFNVPHVSLEDTTVAGYFIPKGSHVLLSRSALGRNPKVWEEPLKFKPERHLKEDGVSLTLTEADLRFISFSTGMRGCKGILLGSTVTVMVFARLLQCFGWSIPPGNGPTIDLSEAEDSLFLAKPLVAIAKPRLPAHMYPVHLA
ncbi:hypothetical protein V6N13_144426 [Hibiscus sabdariffa]|uniref:Cytochrome P450 n=1 Tax=Hibiscus sabdariffa TaxID=183260 RepID=A0ABR2FKN0_9ROSI